MKYLITESQIDRIIFKYLDNQDFIVKGYKNTVRFLNSEDDVDGLIGYSNVSEMCYFKKDLVDELIDFFSIEKVTAGDIIAKWVSNKLNVPVVGYGIFSF